MLRLYQSKLVLTMVIKNTWKSTKLILQTLKWIKKNTLRTNLDLKFQLHENSTQDGHLIWRINDFKIRTNDAVIGKIRALHSAPCYTANYGYKFCLRLYWQNLGKIPCLLLFMMEVLRGVKVFRLNSLQKNTT